MTLLRVMPRNTADTVANRTDTAWTPATDIIEAEDKYTLVIDLPGLTKEDIQVTVTDSVLTVHGERKLSQAADEKYYHNYERTGGRFSRSFKLPDHVDENGLKAAYNDGVLSLDILKKESAKPYTVKIS